jgi:rubrerythrin
MNAKLSAFEILTMAEAIERDSIDFYRKAARRFDDEGRRKMFLLLAGWERKHQEVFSAMKRELANVLGESMTFDVSGFVSSNPQRLVGLASSAPGSESKRELTGKESKEEILELAISRERNIVGFYYNLIGVMGDFIGTGKINDIIEEEKRHIGILRRATEKLNDQHSSVSARDR